LDFTLLLESPAAVTISVTRHVAPSLRHVLLKPVSVTPAMGAMVIPLE
jgi:hypothetical protein